MVKFLILILNKSYFLTLRNNALIFVFFVIVLLELRGIVECEWVNYCTQVPLSKTIRRNWIITYSGGGPMITCGLEPTLFMNKETALSWSHISKVFFKDS